MSRIHFKTDFSLTQANGVAQHVEKPTLHDGPSATNARAQKTLAATDTTATTRGVTTRIATTQVATTTDAATTKGTAEPTGSAKNVSSATVLATGTVTSAPEMILSQGMEQEEVARTGAEVEQVQVTAERITTTGSKQETLNGSFQSSEGAGKMPNR